VNHVFTYGSLMFERVWSRVVSGTYRKAAGSLVGFKRQRVTGQDYPALRIGDAGEAGGLAAVEGVIYFDVRPEDLSALDAFEGADYRRIQVPVTVRGHAPGGPAAGSIVTADTYLFIADDQVEPGAWDPGRFERDRIERFLRDYPPPRPA
jgi:gamma-glutamylcyclotransferase (GGCT)/AIG2-like uncharacterized protein YtfP